jgi:hypothetical protein
MRTLWPLPTETTATKVTGPAIYIFAYTLLISDLFIEHGKASNGSWSLFCPNKCTVPVSFRRLMARKSEAIERLTESPAGSFIGGKKMRVLFFSALVKCVEKRKGVTITRIFPLPGFQ